MGPASCHRATARSRRWQPSVSRILRTPGSIVSATRRGWHLGSESWRSYPEVSPRPSNHNRQARLVCHSLTTILPIPSTLPRVRRYQYRQRPWRSNPAASPPSPHPTRAGRWSAWSSTTRAASTPRSSSNSTTGETSFIVSSVLQTLTSWPWRSNGQVIEA